jgi:quercetin dioxygenase-like cupin family protein
MKEISLTCLLLLLFAFCEIASGQGAQDRSAVKCAVDSPERRGEEGCTILASRPLSGATTGSIYWHIDRFDSLEDAKRVVGANSVAAEAHGSVWLMTVEGKTKDHHGGRHVALIGPLHLPAAEGYTMRVASSLLKQGASTPIHIHSGPEAWFIVVGEQCLETEKSAHRLKAVKSFVLATDQINRGRVQSAEMRGALALVLHNSKRPASYDLTESDSSLLMACR